MSVKIDFLDAYIGVGRLRSIIFPVKCFITLEYR